MTHLGLDQLVLRKGTAMKSQVTLLEQLLHDAGDALGFSAERDIITLRWRSEKEGIPFLSITLPRLDDLLLAGLRTGRLPEVIGWTTEGKLPRFLKGAWMQIFDWDGCILPEPSVDAIRWIRQISRLCKKVKEVCEDYRVQSAIDQFVTTDNCLPSRAEIMEALPHNARHVAHLLFGQLIGEAMVSMSDGNHGPGAVSEYLGVNERWNFDSISPNIEALMGPEYFRSSWIDLLERPPRNEVVPARLVAVAKTATTPRLISIEPSYNQFAQQALQNSIKDILERDRFACSYTDQSFNQRMALEASVHGRLATIDLSEASDRVSMALVEELFGFNPNFVKYLRLSRSSIVQLPDGDELVYLNKFASMGSALTFPVECMVFHTLSVLAMMEHSGNDNDWFIRSFQRRSPELTVYGDDIILPTDVAPKLIALLSSLGMKVNDSKSFLSGDFRESCGLDAFMGRVVTPAYQRSWLPQSMADSDEIVKTSSLRNQLFDRFGEIRAVRFLDTLIGRFVKYPAVPRGMDGICRWSDFPDHSFSRWNQGLQRVEWRLPTLIASKRFDPINGYSALQKALRTELNEDPDHLEFAGRPVATKIHYRWSAEV